MEALVKHFVDELTGSADPLPFGWAALEALRAHRWSGNARELRNVVESALAIGKVEVEGESARGDATEPGSYREMRASVIARFERAFLTDLMTASEGNASLAARTAKMDRPYLLALLRKHGLR